MGVGGRHAISVAILLALVGLYGCGGGSDTSEGGSGSGSASFALRGEGSSPTGEETGDNVAPSTPTGLSGSAASPSRINLNWTASTDNVAVTGYRVYRNGALRTTTAGNVLVYQDNGLTASTTYSYTVQAFDAAGNASSQSTAAIVRTPATLDTVAPSIPTSSGRN